MCNNQTNHHRKITHPSKYFADIALPMAKGRYIKACGSMYTVSEVPPNVV
jgi:hypothetical protein